MTGRETETAQIVQFGAGESTAPRECDLKVGALVGFGGEQVQHEVEAQVVGAADLVQERLAEVGGDRVPEVAGPVRCDQMAVPGCPSSAE